MLVQNLIIIETCFCTDDIGICKRQLLANTSILIMLSNIGQHFYTMHPYIRAIYMVTIGGSINFLHDESEEYKSGLGCLCIK